MAVSHVASQSVSGGTWDVAWDEFGLDMQSAVEERWGFQTP